MITRVVTLVFIAALALPVTTVTRPIEAHSSPWGGVAVAAKETKGRNSDVQADSGAGRKTVTRTFTSAELLLIPTGASGATMGPADPYPSTIQVGGLRDHTITDVNLVLTGLTHDYPADVDILLSKDGRGGDLRALVLSDVGDDNQILDIDLTLDDEATAEMSDSRLTSGTYRPTNLARGDDSFDPPAPFPDRNVALSTFDGTAPNGAWRLWVMDNSTGESGSLDGWALEITATKDKKHKKGKGGKRGKR